MAAAMAAVLHSILTLLLFLLHPASAQPDPEQHLTDATALLLFKDSLTNTTALSSWSPTNTAPCDDRAPWAGLICFHGILTGLRLGGMGLGGTVNLDALSHFKGIRTISFIGNALTGTIPNFHRFHALKSVYLSNNRFSGDIPDGFFGRMGHLKKLWLDGNGFTGRIPSSLANASRLIEIRLDGNKFTGPIPDLDIPSLKSFNVSGNSLTGPIPKGLSRFDATSFKGNPGLCGPQLANKTCDPPPPPPPPAESPSPAAAAVTAQPAVAAGAALPAEGGSGKTVAAAVVVALVVTAVVIGWVTVKKKRGGEQFDTLGATEHRELPSAEAMEAARTAAVVAPPLGDGSQKQFGSGHKRSGSSKRGGSAKGGGVGPAKAGAELVMVSEEKGVFGLADLMKAAAEVLGNGGLGSAYKAVMADGMAVVVKRMRELNRVGKDVFDVEMRRLGRLSHRNVLVPLAYHYRRDEKLVVFEFVHKGSLLYVLHGDRGPDHAALDWPTRLKIVRGVASAMAYLHSELAPLDVPHGNLKSGNILIGPDFEPLVADYGYIPLVNPSQAAQSLFAYKSPEALAYRHVSPKSDVYCLGIVILELMTGKFPSQYLNNTKGGTDVVQWAASAIAERREAELLDPDIAGVQPAVPDMVRLLRFGSACADMNPEQRPTMKDAATMIEEIATAATGGGRETVPPTASLIDCYAELPLSASGKESSSTQANGDATSVLHI